MSSFICLDLGASSTRYCSDDGIIQFQNNNVCIIAEDTDTRLEAWSTELSEDGIKQSLDVSITRCDEEESEYFPVRALVGDVAKRFSKSSIRPGGMKNKHKQQINYISAITATAVGLVEKGVDSDAVYMYIALPPIEAKPAENYVKQQLIGKFKVKFNMLNKEITLDIKEVKCLEESYMAITSFFFNVDGSVNTERSKYATGNLLSLDIGASTTDLATTQNKKFLEKTGKTYQIGGNVVRDKVAEYIYQEFGYEADNITAEHVVEEGRVQQGNTFVDFGEWVKLAKEEYAIQIINNMQTYFRTISIPLQSYKGIVVSGGGSKPSEYIEDDGTTVKTSEAMSYYIAEKLKDICSTIDVLPIGDDPRQANIRGMFIRASYDKKKRAEAV